MVRKIGADGRDILIGTNLLDVLFGMSGDDVLCGYAGDDLLDGGAGADVLYGGAGNDRLFGRGEGDDSANFLASIQNDRFTSGGNGYVVVSHLNGTGADGIDTVDQGVDTLVFAGSGISFSEAQSLIGASASTYGAIQ